MNLQNKTFQLAAPLSVVSIAFSALLPSAFAAPHHRTSLTSTPTAPTVCTFPDGTAPDRAGQHCYAPADFLKAYGIDKLHAAGITGKGQTIILADSFSSPTLQADLDHFSDTFHLPRTTIQFIYPDGPYVNDLADDGVAGAGADKTGWATETTLDLEWAHAIAPDATLVNIVTNTSETVGLAGLPDLFKGIQMAAQQYPNSIISMSFGTGEATFTPSDITNYLQGSFHDILKQASAANITLLSSAGDSGSAELDANQAKLVPYATAGYPASDPLVTSVGGTSLQYGWKWQPEVSIDQYWACEFDPSQCKGDVLASVASDVRTESLWNEGWAIAAGGGGVSSIFSAPDYQAKVNSAARTVMAGHRGTPDVAMNAAINGGVEIYTSYTNTDAGANGPTWQATGGTSCASPETAALIALAGQKASDLLGKTVGIGFLNPILYSLPATDFNDIVSESFGTSNQVTIDNNALYFNATFSPVLASKDPKNAPGLFIPGFNTTPGYDLASGRGTPKAEQFVLDIANARVKALQNLR
jgi:subtilase family serine protease